MSEKGAQSKAGSLIESMANLTIGYLLSVGVNLVVFPQYGINLPLSSNLTIVAIFTVVSLIRTYVLRRIFNRIKGL